MADFTTVTLEANVGDNSTQSWQNVLVANGEIRWHDTSSQSNVTAASWPYVTRPTSGTGTVDYAYAFTAVGTGEGVQSGAGSAPAAFNVNQWLSFRFGWDVVGTFASAPIITSYLTTAHGAITRAPDATNGGQPNLLQGSTTDTGATARSYLKGTAFGQVATGATGSSGGTGAPSAGPASPTVTDGATGAVTPTAGANWSSWQGLQGDNDYLQFPSVPAATTAAWWYFMLRLFMGVNLNPATYTPTLSLKYTWT